MNCSISQRRLSAKELTLSNCGAGEDSWEPLGPQGDQTSQSWRKSILNIQGKDYCWSWSSNTSATWCKVLTHWKRSWCWEKLRARGEGGDKGWDGWMASLTQWTCCLVVQSCLTLSEPMNCSLPAFPVLYHLPELAQTHVHCGRTGKPGVLQSMGSQRVKHDLATEQQ